METKDNYANDVRKVTIGEGSVEALQSLLSSMSIMKMIMKANYTKVEGVQFALGVISLFQSECNVSDEELLKLIKQYSMARVNEEAQKEAE